MGGGRWWKGWWWRDPAAVGDSGSRRRSKGVLGWSKVVCGEGLVCGGEWFGKDEDEKMW